MTADRLQILLIIISTYIATECMRHLRSATSALIVPSTRRSSLGDRAFLMAAARGEYSQCYTEQYAVSLLQIVLSLQRHCYNHKRITCQCHLVPACTVTVCCYVQVLVPLISFSAWITAVCQWRHDVMVVMTVQMVLMKQIVVSNSTWCFVFFMHVFFCFYEKIGGQLDGWQMSDVTHRRTDICYSIFRTLQ